MLINCEFQTAYIVHWSSLDLRNRDAEYDKNHGTKACGKTMKNGTQYAMSWVG